MVLKFVERGKIVVYVAFIKRQSVLKPHSLNLPQIEEDPDNPRDTDRLLPSPSSPSSSNIQSRRRPSIPPTHSKVYNTNDDDDDDDELLRPPSVGVRPAPLGFFKVRWLCRSYQTAGARLLSWLEQSI